MGFQANDRFRVKENGLEGIVNAVSFNSIYQETEYYVTWDSFPNKGQVCYMATDVDSIWEKMAKLKEALEAAEPNRGYVSQDGDTYHLPNGGTLIGMNRPSNENTTSKQLCDHKWVEVGFHHTKVVCKFCDVEQK